MPALDEFSLIKQYFSQRQTQHPRVRQSIGDDCALVDNSGLQAVSVDTSIAGTHFPEDTPPEDIAWRALNVSVSDLAAMGASADFFTLALSLPDTGESWLEAFSRGLFEAADVHGIKLIGGDTTKGHLSITVQVQGSCDSGKALLRSGAQPGDTIYVTGPLGDAAGGLACYQAGQTEVANTTKHQQALLKALLRPTAQIDIGRALLGHANACIDISDGFLADLGHILEASSVGAVIDVQTIPLSTALLAEFGQQQALQFALTGGDDYCLCFTGAGQITEVAGQTVYAVGTIKAGSGLELLNLPDAINLKHTGYQHFHES